MKAQVMASAHKMTKNYIKNNFMAVYRAEKYSSVFGKMLKKAWAQVKAAANRPTVEQLVAAISSFGPYSTYVEGVYIMGSFRGKKSETYKFNMETMSFVKDTCSLSSKLSTVFTIA